MECIQKMDKEEIIGSTHCHNCNCIHNVFGVYVNDELMTEYVHCEDTAYDFYEAKKNGWVSGFNKKVYAIRSDLFVGE